MSDITEPKDATESSPEVAPEAVAVKPEETAHDVNPHDDVRGLVTALDAKVSALESTVQGLLPENRDEKPVKPPWTHRRF
jgi:hypothetical protein